MTTTIVVGNPRAGSRTLDAARRVSRALTGADADLEFDLAQFGTALLDPASTEVAEAVAAVRATDLLVVASPTYKASYTGVLKVFLDRFGAGELSGVTAVALMLGGDWRHSLAVDAFLTPVLVEIGASTPTRGLFLRDADYADSAELQKWLSLARTQLPSSLLGAQV